MAQDNSAVVRRAVERIWNCGDLFLADSLFTPTYVNHGGLIPDIVHGPEAIKVSVALYRAAFPGLFISIDGLEEDGEMVEVRWAALTGGDDLAGSDATASPKSGLTGLARGRLFHGQIAESWMDWDRDAVLCLVTAG